MEITNIRSQLVARPVFANLAGYLLVFLVASLVFAYVRFPAEVFKPMVVSAARDAGLKVAFERMDITFPPGLAMTDVEISPSGMGEQKFDLQMLKVRPSLTSAIIGAEKYIVSTSAYGGMAYAEVGIGDNGHDINTEFSFDDLDPGMAAFWKTFKWVKLAASLSGSGSLNLPDGVLLKGTGVLDTKLNGGVITIGKLIAPDSPQLILDSGAASIELKAGRIKINRFEVSGPQLKAEISGEIGLSSTPRFSRLALALTVKFDEALVKRLGPLGIMLSGGEKTFRIGGTLQNPLLLPAKAP